MRVPRRRDAVGARVRGPGEHLGQRGPARRRGPRDVVQVQRVQQVLQGAQDLVVPRPVGGQLPHQLDEHVDVEEEMPYVLVEHGQVRRGEAVQRGVARGQHVAEAGRREAVAQHGRVGGGLQEEADRLAPDGGGGDGHMPVARVDALEGYAVGVVDEPLRLETRPVAGEAGVDDGLDAPPRPAARHRAVEPEPARRPRPPPGRAGREGLVRRLQRLLYGHGLAGGVPGGERQRGPLRVLRGPDELVERPFQAPFHQWSVVVHHGS